MANIKISSLQNINISNPDNSYIMVVAEDAISGRLKNYRITLSQLRNIIGNISGDIIGVTEEQVIQIVNNAIELDNQNEISAEQVQEMINVSISNLPEPGLNEEQIKTLIKNAIDADNINELTEEQVNSMIDNSINNSITVDKLKNVVNAIVPETAINVNETTAVTVQEMAEMVINQETVIKTIETDLSNSASTTEDADNLFYSIFV